MKKVKRMFPFLLVIIIDFYILPLLIKNTLTAIILLLVIIPFICFACSIIYGIKNSFHLLFAFIVSALFVPSIFIFYNSSAWVYIICYGIISLLGNTIGSLFYNIIERNKNNEKNKL